MARANYNAQLEPIEPEKKEWVQYKIGDVWVQIVESEEFSSSTMITEHVIESGSYINDHKRELPSILTISGKLLDEYSQNVSAEDKRKAILELKASSELIDIQTPKTIYRNYVIQDIGFGKHIGILNGYEVNITLKQLRVVSTQQEFIDESSIPLKRQSKKKKGKVSKYQEDDDILIYGPSWDALMKGRQ